MTESVSRGKISKAMTDLVLDHPFFSSLALRLKVVETEACETGYVNGHEIGYNPKWIEPMPVPQIRGFIAHEVMHLAMCHQTRIGERDHGWWNIACVRGDTLITMNDASTQPITLVRPGDRILGEYDGEIIEQKVLDIIAKYDTLVEIVMHNGNKLYCTPSHRLLTEVGYGKVSSLDTKGKGFCYSKHRNHANNKNGEEFERQLQASRCISPQEWAIQIKKSMQTQELDRYKSIVEDGLGLHGRDNRRRGNNLDPNVDKEVFSAAYSNINDIICTCGMVRKTEILRNIEKIRSGSPVLANYYKRLSDNRNLKTNISIFNNQKEPCGVGCRIYQHSLIAETSRQANYKNDGYIPKDKTIEQTRIKSIRRFKTKEPVFDLVTSKHSYITNGIISHNCDFAINNILQSAGFELPDTQCIDPKYKDQSAEEIYSKIYDGNDKGGSGSNSDPGGCGSVQKKQGSPNDLKQEEQEWKSATISAMNAAKSQGNVPGELLRMVEEMKRPKLDWREMLREFVETSAKNDYNWKIPNRRYSQQRIILPSLLSKELGTAVIAVDTSGSVSQGELDQFAGEISSILEEYQDITIQVLYCDTQVAKTEEFHSSDLPIQLKIHGGGGTDFRPPFTWVKKNLETPTCLIYFTDLECRSFPKDPGYPTIWVWTKTHSGRSYGTPPFGQVISMDMRNDL